VHALDYGSDTFTVLVDVSYPVAPVPITATSHRVDTGLGGPPAFTVEATWPNVVQLLATVPGAIHTPAFSAWLQAAVITRAVDDSVITVPIGPDQALYPWQVSAAARFAATGAALLSDEPGTGKTISAIMAMRERQHQHGDALPALVIAPGSVVSAWVEAVLAWAPEWSVTDYRGPKRRLGADVSVTSYETMVRSAGKLREHGFHSLVLDEHHRIKNRGTARSSHARRLGNHIAHVIALSGTPITHGPDDAWPALYAIDPESFPSEARYTARYCDMFEDENGTPKTSALRGDREAEHTDILTGVWRRVDKATALPFLPPKVYSKRMVDVPKEWRIAYDGMAEAMAADLPDGSELDVMSTLAQITRLIQLASSPCDVETTPHEDPEKPDRTIVTMRAPSWKIDALLEVLDERPDQQVLVFAAHRQLIELAADELGKRGISYGKVVGGQTTKLRDAERDAFQAGDTRVMLATLSAGGEGLTLTAASTVVFLQRPYSMIESRQAEDRAHRVGSERHETVEIVDIIARDTIEQRIRAVLRERTDTLSAYLRGTGAAALLAP
jgi:SNF2 family DNA or RNA helicase